MAATYFIADTHFGDGRILRYENRPFEDTCQMDTALIAGWNETVRPDDIVYLLGDFGADGYEKEILDRLNGTKYLIKGNHDTKTNREYREAGFAEVYDHPILLDNFWILSHEAVYVNTNMPYGNLFGHVHATPLIRDFSRQHYCVCVERTNYRPISFDAIKQSVANATA